MPSLALVTFLPPPCAREKRARARQRRRENEENEIRCDRGLRTTRPDGDARASDTHKAETGEHALGGVVTVGHGDETGDDAVRCEGR